VKKARVALVTGANRGMGVETSRQLLGRGLRVVMTGRDLKATSRALDSLGAAAANGIAVQMDVTDVSSIESAHKTVLERFGAVDILINNAAVLIFENSEVLSIPRDAFDETFETNLFGVIEVCRAFVPEMAVRGYGRVVNVSCRLAPGS
jgi:NAD(P)-dependent dehydrogenase (short-subunit alcohol dehydrogenase family)